MSFAVVGVGAFLVGAATFSAIISGTTAFIRKRKIQGRLKYKGDKLKADLGSLKHSLLSHIDEDVSEVIVEAEALRRRFVSNLGETIRKERRFSMRVNLKPGEMIIHWVNTDGSIVSGNAINCSMTGILFEAETFDADCISSIEVPGSSIEISVKSSIIVRQSDGKIAIMLGEFDNNEDNWMRWIELMTRLGNN